MMLKYNRSVIFNNIKNTLGYFSIGIDNKHKEVFFITFDFGNSVTEYACYKNPDHLSFIF